MLFRKSGTEPVVRLYGEAANDGDGSHEYGEHDLAGAECLLDFVVHRCDVRVFNGAMGVGHWSTILIRGGILPVGI